MRLPRFLLAGILILAGIFLLTALFAQSPYSSVGVTAAAVFIPLWYVISVINAWLGVVSAGYSRAEELSALALVFGLPAAAAFGILWVSMAFWNGGPIIHSGRTPFMVAAGLALWGAVVLIAGLLAPDSSAVRSATTAAIAFVPFWVLVGLVNLVIGVVSEGYSVREEIPVFLLSVAAPVGVAIAAWKFVPATAEAHSRILDA